jgi:mono/diheme cytochrome c family protein
MPDNPNRAETREYVDPEERIRPMPILAAAIAVGMFIFGVIYILTVGPLTPTQYGDERTLADLQARPAGAGSGGPVDGKAIFAANCVACHQATGTGVPGVFPPLAGSEWAQADGRVIANILLHGINGPLEVEGKTFNGQMPSFAHLSDAELAGVATYVRSSFGNQAPAVDAATVTEQRKAGASRTTPFNGTAGLKELEQQLGGQKS